MRPRLDSGPMQYTYTLLDIREIRIEELLASSRPADYALAILAGGSAKHLEEIIARIQSLPDEERKRAFSQLAVMSGLRSMSVNLEMELTRMSVIIEISKNVILQKIQKEGEAIGEARGQQAGFRTAVRQTLETRFGRLPEWADARLEQAKLAQLKRWNSKAITADSLSDVIGPR